MTTHRTPTAHRTPARRATRAVALSAALLLGAALALAGCGDDGEAGTPTTPSPSTPVPSTPSASAADITFLQGMVPHHEQATEMAALVDGRTQDADVVALAEQIRAEQQPEVEEMTALLAAYGEPLPSAGATEDSMAGMGGMDHGDGATGMAGMMGAEEMTSLESLSGTEFDRAWLSMMVEHHEGAIAMFQDVLDGSGDPRVRKVAEGIVTAQQAEIATMRELLDAG
ncbi:DUF305 domain-containing protein [Pseudokineococcus basanitobsidens]|uniref:DUF305 domain-containing protein n=1 Tax=Pseudokineococcus basanitobsidens TaxID=1926649 RepID=A0ABU8RFN2_9ACTN